MFTASRIVGIALVLYAAYSIYRGSIGLSEGYWNKSVVVKRAEKPGRFWFSVGLLLVIGGLLAFNVVHF